MLKKSWIVWRAHDRLFMAKVIFIHNEFKVNEKPELHKTTHSRNFWFMRNQILMVKFRLEKSKVVSTSFLISLSM